MLKKRLMQQRDQLLKQVEALNNRVAGLEMAIALIDSNDVPTEGSTFEAAPKRVNVKTMVLDLLDEVGTTGLNAVTAVDIAKRRGIQLDKGSVSSLLSRLKKDDVVVYDNDKYRLKKFVQRPQPQMKVVNGGLGAPAAELDDDLPF